VFAAVFRRERVGELPTELVAHFFRSLADSLRASIHVRVEGENDHHQVEAIFKALGRALRDAFRLEGGGVPSTKGMLG
jgi:imidazoleglycerol-phosphate dehydratase / histidinol-phosphatase